MVSSLHDLVDVLSSACRLPVVGGEQEEMNVDFQWNFPDPHVNHGSAIRWMGGVWSKGLSLVGRVTVGNREGWSVWCA